MKSPGRIYDIKAPSVILAAGGFQGDAEMRTRYLGPGWELAKVRGTRFNTGDGIKMALDIGASPFGNYSGCHAVQWDFNAPEYGDLAVGDAFQKHSYPWSVLINADGKRFLDEGADFRNYTYAKYGRVVLEQPGNFAWQVFDQKVAQQLRDEYRIKQVTKVRADTLEELAGKLEGVDAKAFLEEIRAYNAAVKQDVPFNPNVKDGRCTEGLAVNKSNWANTIEDGPFEAYQVGCGITFTFGGLRIDTEARVLDADQQPITGLYAAGRAGGRHLLLQLSRRVGPDQRRGLRQAGRGDRGRRPEGQCRRHGRAGPGVSESGGAAARGASCYSGLTSAAFTTGRPAVVFLGDEAVGLGRVHPDRLAAPCRSAALAQRRQVQDLLQRRRQPVDHRLSACRCGANSPVQDRTA